MEAPSKKGDMAQAGRKKLEDFRRKKAEAAAAKAKALNGGSLKKDSAKPSIQSDAKRSDANTASNAEAQGTAGQRESEGLQVEPSRLPTADPKQQGSPLRPASNAGSLRPISLDSLRTGANSQSSNGNKDHLEGVKNASSVSFKSEAVPSSSQANSAVQNVGVEKRRDTSEGTVHEGIKSKADERQQTSKAEPNPLAGIAPAESKLRTAEPAAPSSIADKPRGQMKGSTQTQAEEQSHRSSGSGLSSIGGPNVNSLSAAPIDSSLNGGTDRGESSSIPSQPPSSSPDAPSKDRSSEVPTTIPFLSPSLPSPSPSPHSSPSPTVLQPVGVRPASTTVASRPPWLGTPSLLQTAPPAVSFRQAAPSLSQANELISRHAVPASLQGLSSRLGANIANQDLTSSEAQRAGQDSAPLFLRSSSERDGQQNSAASVFLSASNNFPASSPLASAFSQSAAAASEVNRVPSQIARPAAAEMQQNVVISRGVEVRPGEAIEGSASARLPAARAMPGADTARRRLDFALAQQSESRIDAILEDPALSGVPRVQSQPSFKDYVTDDNQAGLLQPRSQTPDPVSPVVFDPRGFTQTASSLRSSLANLFAPTASFPRPNLGNGQEAKKEEDSTRLETTTADSIAESSSLSGPARRLVPASEPRPPPSQTDLPASTSQTTSIARNSRSPFVPITADPAEASKPPPAKLTETSVSKPLTRPIALKPSSSEDKPKPDISNSRNSVSNGPNNLIPSWSRARPQSPPIDLNPPALPPPSFTFPSSNGARQISASHAPSQRERPPNEEVLVSPRKEQARSPRRRPKSPVPEPRSPHAEAPPMRLEPRGAISAVDDRPPIRLDSRGATSAVAPIGLEPRGSSSAVDDRRQSSSTSNGSLDEKSLNGSASNGAPHIDGPHTTSVNAEPPVDKTPAKPPAKRSLLFSALAPQNPKPPVRSSFLSSPEEANGKVNGSEAESPSRRPSTSLFAPIPSSGRSPKARDRLLRMPSMPPVSEASPSPGDRNDGGDFASLEQHIEDLTSEKFALQRGAEAARALAASLEEENSQLTEDFNRQAQAVQTLKAEVERQQAEIEAQQLVAEAMSEERERLQRENAGALEQAQVMGREVVHLEEQVLKLRSTELKLRKELEATQSGHEAARRQLTTLAADRASLRQMMDALQEERRLLVARLRMLGAKDALEEVRAQIQTGTGLLERADATTSTDDLPIRTELLPGTLTAPSQLTDSQVGTSTVESASRGTDAHSEAQALTESERATSRLQAETNGNGVVHNAEAQRSERLQISLPSTSSAERVAAAVAAAVLAVQNSPSTSRLGRSASSAVNGAIVAPVGIPEDQARVIENVNRLLYEVGAERRAMATALAAETEACEELRISNSELSRKLAMLSEQLRSSESGQQEDMPSLANGTVVETARVDEGDEVVERVLGWITRFFAGKQGPA